MWWEHPRRPTTNSLGAGSGRGFMIRDDDGSGLMRSHTHCSGSE